MNGWIRRSLSPWSAGQDDATSVLSESVEERKMPFHRKREDGSYVKNTILKRIYKDFGSLSKANKNPYYMTYTKSTFPALQKRMKAEISPGSLISAKYEPYKPKGTPRYSKIDQFIDNLNQACAALPKPLIEDVGRGRPHTVEVQSQPKAEVRMIRVSGSEPTPAQTNAGEQQVDQASSMSPIKSGVVPTPGFTQIVCASPEMGPWKVIDEGNHAIVNCGRQATKPCSGDAFESKKEEVVRAATMLQARYRGYKVRRSQPLRSMLMIGGAKSKLEELKQQFTAWKIAVWFPADYSERLAMTENVTNLLTELHSIKGVPPYIKEFRKSVTRDVLKFQDEVDTFFRYKSKEREIYDPVRKENTQRPKSRTERGTGNCSISGSASLNEHRDSWKTVELSSTMQREFGPGEELSGVLDTNDVSCADIDESEESDAENTVQRHQLEADFISPLCPAELVRPQEDSTSCPRPSIELEVEEENGISHGVEQVAFDIFFSVQEDSSRTSRKKKKYGVRFEDLVSQREIDSVIKPCSVTEESVLSPEEESSCHNVPVLKSDHEHYFTSSSSIQPCSDTEQSFHSAEEGSSSPAGTLMSDYRHIVESSCSSRSRRTELTDILEQRCEVYPSASTSMPVFQNQCCPTVDAEDEAGSRKQESQFGCIGIAYEHAPRNTVAVQVHSNEGPNCLDFNGNVHVHGQLKYKSHMDGTRNTLVNGFGATTIPTKSRFHDEQSNLWTSPRDGPIQPNHSHVHYEGSCNSSDSATSETSEGLNKLDDHERNYKVFRSEGAWTKVPPLEQKQMVTLADQATDLRALLESPRLRRSCGDSPSMRMCSRNALDKRTSSAEVVEGIDGVQDVDKVSCCSDCARPQGHDVSECWKPTVSTGEEKICLLPCNEYPREVQESYIPLGYKDAGSPDEYNQSPKREEFCGFDHRELRYAVDPYTWKLRRVRQATQTRTTKNDGQRTPCQQDLERRASTAVQYVPKAFAHKATSYTPTPSPSETICSQAGISYPRCRSHSPSRRGSVHEETRAWEPDEVQTADRELLTKLADDNKRLKRLLKDVMNWNKAQATAMVSMSERIGHLEGLDTFH